MTNQIQVPKISEDSVLFLVKNLDDGSINSCNVKDVDTNQLSNRAGPAVVDAVGSAYYVDGVNLTEEMWRIVVMQNLTPVKTESGISLYKRGTNKLHAEGGAPAVWWFDTGEREYYYNGRPHRTDGPAVTQTKEYFLDGWCFSKEGFEAWHCMREHIHFIHGDKKVIFNADGFIEDAPDNDSTLPYYFYLEMKQKYPSTTFKLKQLIDEAGLDVATATAIFLTKEDSSIDLYLSSVRYNKSLNQSPLGHAIEFWEKSALAEWAQKDAAGAIIKIPDALRARLHQRPDSSVPPYSLKEASAQLEMPLAEPGPTNDASSAQLEISEPTEADTEEEDNSGAMLATGAFALAAIAVAMLGKKRTSNIKSKKNNTVVHLK